MTQFQEQIVLEDSEVDEIAISVLSRVKELTFGEHKSIFTGSGFDFSGLREWQPGDRQVSIDWAHSTHTGFSPLIVRECVEERSVDLWIVADRSYSVQCGLNGDTIGRAIARTIAIIGLSGVVFQDRIGMIAFDKNNYFIEPPKGGKKQVHWLVDLYKQPDPSRLISFGDKDSLTEVISSSLRRTSMVVVVSDFLFPDAESTIKELTDIRSGQDIFLVMIDASLPFQIRLGSDGWIEAVDVETGESRLFSRREFLALGSRVKAYQEALSVFSEKQGFETVKTGIDKDVLRDELADFFLLRRARKR